MNNISHRVNKLFDKEYLVISIILLMGLILRLYKIDGPIADWHSWRQADTASVARIYKDEGINLAYPRYYDISTAQSSLFNPQGFRFVEFPIYNAIIAVFSNIQIFTLEIWARLVSIISSLVSTYIVFLLGKRYISYSGGVLASFFYATLPFNIYFTRVILPEPLATSLSLLALWMFSQYIKKESQKVLYLSSLFFAIALLVKPFAVFFIIPISYLAIKKYGISTIFQKKHVLIAFTLAFVPLVIWRIWISHFPEGIPEWKWVFNGDGIRFKPSFWMWIFGERLGKLILGVWGVVPFTIGVLSYKKDKAFVHYFGLGMLIYLFVVATANVKHDYYQTVIIPSVSFMLAFGAINLWEGMIFPKLLSRGVVVFSLIMMFIVGGFQIREFYKVNRPEIIEAGRAIEAITSKDDLIIAPYNGDTAFLYQTKRFGWPVVDRPIEELIEKGASYFVSVDLNHPQTREFSERYTVIEKTDKYVIIKLE